MATLRPIQECRAVISIDGDVRSLLNLYVGLFSSYAAAAGQLHISRDTLGSYVNASTNMADYVFERMANILERRVCADEIRKRINGRTLADLRNRIHQSDLRRTDNVVCEITPAVRELMALYASHFRSRGRAARALGINHRTFKAYFSGQIRAFPCNKLREMVDQLRKFGYTDDELLKSIKTTSWDDVFELQTRAPTLDLPTSKLVDRLEPHFASGRLANHQIEPSLLNLSRRVDGSLGNTLRRVVAVLANRQEKEIQASLRKGDLKKADSELERWNRYILAYREKLAATNRALPRDKKRNWRRETRLLMQRKDDVAAQISKARALQRRTPSPGSSPVSLVEPRRENGYDPDGTYRAGDVIRHATLGRGTVLSVETRNRIRVRFQDSTEVLLRGRPVPPAAM